MRFVADSSLLVRLYGCCRLTGTPANAHWPPLPASAFGHHWKRTRRGWSVMQPNKGQVNARKHPIKILVCEDLTALPDEKRLPAEIAAARSSLQNRVAKR